MLKQYVLWQLKKWWPLILIISLAISLPFVSILQTASLVQTSFRNTYGEGYYYGGSGLGVVQAAFTVLAILAMISTFVVPVFVFVYRTSLQAVDCFYQAGFEKRTIRKARMLLGLGIILVSFLIAFLIGLFVLGMRYLATPEVYETTNRIDTRININFGYILLIGLVTMVLLTVQYFINCFFASLGDSALVQIMLMLCGFAITSLAIASPIIFVCQANEFTIPNYVNPATSVAFTGWCFGPISSIASLFVFFIVPIGEEFVWMEEFWRFIVGLSVSVLLGVGAGVFLFLAPEPSGESAGHWKPRNVYISIIPHAAALAIGLILATSMGATSIALNIIGGYSLILFYFVSYYALLSLMRKSFKPSKVDLIVFLSVCGTVLLATLGMTTMASAAAARETIVSSASSSIY